MNSKIARVLSQMYLFSLVSFAGCFGDVTEKEKKIENIDIKDESIKKVEQKSEEEQKVVVVSQENRKEKKMDAIIKTASGLSYQIIQEAAKDAAMPRQSDCCRQTSRPVRVESSPTQEQHQRPYRQEQPQSIHGSY